MKFFRTNFLKLQLYVGMHIGYQRAQGIFEKTVGNSAFRPTKEENYSFPIFPLCGSLSLFSQFVSPSLPIPVLSPVSVWMAVFLSLSPLPAFSLSSLCLIPSFLLHSPPPTFNLSLLVNVFIISVFIKCLALCWLTRIQ